MAARLAELEVEGLFVTRLPNVRYLTGFTGSNGQLVLTAGSGQARLLTDGRYTVQSAREAPDVERRIYSDDLPGEFGKACADLAVGRVAFESHGVTHEQYVRLSGGPATLVPTVGEVEAIRWVKDPGELEMLRAAQSAADASFLAVLERLDEGVSERQVARLLEDGMRDAGADGPGFETIVAFGPDAAEPHHQPVARELRRGDVVKMDFGAIVGGYHSDMTRTVAFGDPGGTLREVHDVVRRAQAAGIQAVRAGVTSAEVDAAARGVVEEAGYGRAFSHGLGHGVGLEIHEGPFLRAGGQDVLPEGAVVTVEPGVYLEGVGGIRIEDMVEVTAAGSHPMPTSGRELMIL